MKTIENNMNIYLFMYQLFTEGYYAADSMLVPGADRVPQLTVGGKTKDEYLGKLQSI